MLPTPELMYIDFMCHVREGGRGLRQIEASWHNAITGMGKYVVSHQDDPLMRQVMKSDRKNGKQRHCKCSKKHCEQDYARQPE